MQRKRRREIMASKHACPPMMSASVTLSFISLLETKGGKGDKGGKGGDYPMPRLTAAPTLAIWLP